MADTRRKFLLALLLDPDVEDNIHFYDVLRDEFPGDFDAWVTDVISCHQEAPGNEQECNKLSQCMWTGYRCGSRKRPLILGLANARGVMYLPMPGALPPARLLTLRERIESGLYPPVLPGEFGAVQ